MLQRLGATARRAVAETRIYIYQGNIILGTIMVFDFVHSFPSVGYIEITFFVWREKIWYFQAIFAKMHRKNRGKIFQQMLFFDPECRNFCRYKKKNRIAPRIFSLFDPNIMIMWWKKVPFYIFKPLMSNLSPENIWGSAEIFSHFFAILGKTFFFFMEKNPFFLQLKSP